MDENETFFGGSVGGFPPHSGLEHHASNSPALPADKRVAHLLFVLHELDEALTGLEGLSEARLSELVSSAIRGCGINDPNEASLAICAVLRMLDTSGHASNSS